MVAFFKENTAFDPIKFLQVIDEGDERVLILSRLHFTHLEDVLEINQAGQIRLMEKPEDLVFLA
jgi:hypothetical protein